MGRRRAGHYQPTGSRERFEFRDFCVFQKARPLFLAMIDGDDASMTATADDASDRVGYATATATATTDEDATCRVDYATVIAADDEASGRDNGGYATPPPIVAQFTEIQEFEIQECKQEPCTDAISNEDPLMIVSRNSYKAARARALSGEIVTRCQAETI